jgi:Domain of unknown function (DUF222)/HNH endonuclease
MEAAPSLNDLVAAATCSLEAAITELVASCVRVDSSTIVATRRLVDLAELVCTRAIGVFEDGRSFTDEGHVDLSAWLAAKTHARKSEGLTRLTHGKVLDLLPMFFSAFAVGDVGQGHLRILASAVTAERAALAVTHEQTLVESACKLSVHQFGLFMNHWAALCDDALRDPDAGDEKLLAKRTLSLHELPDGTWRLSGTLDPLSGETVRAALEAAMPKKADGDTRTVPQRRHDALADLCAESLTVSDRPVVGGERPNVTVLIDAASGLAHTPQRFYLSSFTRDMLLCDATVTSVWLDATGKPFDVGTSLTDIPARNRRAVIARDGCCRYLGCGRPSRWTEIHHMVHREDLGNHDIDNLVTLCRFHHRFIHKHRLKLEWDTDGITLVIRWPNGQTIHSPPTPKATLTG